MERSSIIATVVAGSGVLIAASVATVAVINAAASNAAQPTTVALVAPLTSSTFTPAPPVITGEPSDAVSIAASTESSVPTVTPHELPELPSVPATPSRTASRTGAGVATTSPQPAQTSSKPKPKPSATHRPKPSSSASSASSTPSSSSTTQAPTVTADQARDAVLTATGGGVTRSVSPESHGGYDAWAVQVLRHDGSIVTGYVDRVSGVIFDWKVDQEAPKPTQGSSGSSSGSGSNSGSGSDDHGGKHDDDDHGGDDD